MVMPAASPASAAAAGARGERWQWWLTAALVAFVAMLAVHRLRDFPYHPSWLAAFRGVAQVWRETLWATVKAWTFLAIALAIATGAVRRIAPQLDRVDAILAGAGGLWFLSYLLGQLLGPLGLLRTITLWILFAAAGIWLWIDRRIRMVSETAAPPAPRHPFTPGQRMAMLAVGLLALSMLPMQLASPVVPFMDVLSYPASVQRILTFGVYQPFDNDPYGLWGPYAQTPSLELFYAVIALASHSRLAVLAESAMMLPMAALLIFGAYRLGATLFGDAAGGMASLFLFFTCIFRRAQGMRGTAVDFALVGLGLAFFLDSRRGRMLMALGAMLLGTSVAAHAIDGGLAMLIAGAALLVWILEQDYSRFFAGVGCLAGATLITVPEFAIGLARPIPYPVLPLATLAGAGVIVFSVSTLSEVAPEGTGDRSSWFNWTALALLAAGAIHSQLHGGGSLYENVSAHLPLLFLFASGGLLALAAGWFNDRRARPAAGLVVFALLLGVLRDYLARHLDAIASNPSTRMMVSDIGIKIWDYWSPYFLIFPAGFLFARFYERGSKPFTMLAILMILIYPWYAWRQPVDYDSDEHSIAELWGFNLATAADGYWAGTPDRRWTYGPEEHALLDTIRAEISAGRVTPATHILHLTRSTGAWWSLVQVPVFTGVNDDPIEYEHHPDNLWEAGGRVRGIDSLADALAMRPPYIFTQTQAPPAMKMPPEGYDEIFHRNYMRLYRLRSLSSVAGK